jgi:hypothetical protein
MVLLQYSLLAHCSLQQQAAVALLQSVVTKTDIALVLSVEAPCSSTNSVMYVCRPLCLGVRAGDWRSTASNSICSRQQTIAKAAAAVHCHRNCRPNVPCIA